MEKWYPVNKVWKNLPWNKKEPSCEIEIVYLDSDLRIMKDKYGSIFVYSKTD